MSRCLSVPATILKADQANIQGRLKDRDEEDDSFHRNGRESVCIVNGIGSGSKQPEQLAAELTKRAKPGKQPEQDEHPKSQQSKRDTQSHQPDPGSNNSG